MAFLPFFGELNPELLKLLYLAISLAVIVAGYYTISRSINRLGKRLELDAHVQNSIRLVLRVLTLVVVTGVAFMIFQLPETWFIGGSALIGAVFGFGSSQTINNVVAGFYVLASGPFRVKDYVKIGDLEGQVEEITISYTKLYTPSFNLLLIPNTQVMSSRIVNCTHKGFIEYVFSLSLPHDVSYDIIVRECLEPAMEEFNKKYSEKQLREPEYYFESSTATGRSFKIRIFVPRGEAKTLFSLQPELANMIISRWDTAKKDQAGL